MFLFFKCSTKIYYIFTILRHCVYYTMISIFTQTKIISSKQSKTFFKFKSYFYALKLPRLKTLTLLIEQKGTTSTP